ncbi:MAG: TrmH family RNA methyltransferase, partial [Anaerolineae bacterium]
MPETRLRRYKKDAPHSYTFGVFPTLELLTHRPELALQVVIHPKGERNQGVEKIRRLCHQGEIPCSVQEKAFSRLGARDNDFALAVFAKEESRLDEQADHLLLYQPAGRGNLGTIMRTMLGFGLRDLAIIRPAADPFHPETVRASMGALFQLRLAQFDTFEAYRSRFDRPLTLLMTDGETSLPDADWPSPVTLVFGPEGAGLPPQFRAYGQTVRIPQSGAIDSLNLAIAVGVTLYQRHLA